MDSSLKNTYDPSAFRKQGHELVDLLADYLERIQQGGDDPVLATNDPQAELAFWKKDYKQGGELSNLWSTLIERSIHLHHPHYMGHQISPPAPVAGLAGMLSDVLNNGMGVFEMGPASTALEQLVAEEVCKKMGYGESSGGFLTSGGTLANLTALLSARQAQCGDVWQEGQSQQLAVMVSEEAHYCVDRAVRIMGWGNQGIIKIPSDDQFQLKVDLLDEYLSRATAKGIKVIAVVGCACSTSTGTYDDLEAIGQFCEQNQLWFHVDGAHGGGAIFSEKYKSLLKGIEQADSIAMDFHKMLMTPALVTALVFKNVHSSFQTFAQRAQYLWDQESDLEWFNLAKRTFECTKYMMSVKVYAILRQQGAKAFDDFVSRLYDLGNQFAQVVQQRKHFELATSPQANIVCFRYCPAGIPAEQLNSLNAKIRKEIVADGRFYIVQTQLSDRLYLRTTLMNPFTTNQQMEELLKLIEAFAKT